MTPTIRSLSARYTALVAARDGIALDHMPGGGVRQPLDRAGLGIEATKLAHELASAVADALRAEPSGAPESTLRPRACSICGAEVAAEDGGICARCGGSAR